MCAVQYIEDLFWYIRYHQAIYLFDSIRSKLNWHHLVCHRHLMPYAVASYFFDASNAIHLLLYREITTPANETPN